MSIFKCVLGLVLVGCQPKAQLWENCQYDECDDGLYCLYGQDALTKNDYFYCSKVCNQDDDCGIGPDNSKSECKLFFKNEGLCMIPCSYDFKDGCPEDFTCIGTSGLTKKYCW